LLNVLCYQQHKEGVSKSITSLAAIRFTAEEKMKKMTSKTSCKNCPLTMFLTENCTGKRHVLKRKAERDF